MDGWHGLQAGEECYLQYLPPTLRNLSAPPELMVAQMDYVGVDRAVLQTGHLYGRLNGYLSEAVRRFPERFWALAMIDEWKADSPSQLRTLERAIDRLGLHGLWFQTSVLEQHGRAEMVDDPAFRPFWDSVRDMGIPVYLNATAAGPGPIRTLRSLRRSSAGWSGTRKSPSCTRTGCHCTGSCETGRSRYRRRCGGPWRRPTSWSRY